MIKKVLFIALLFIIVCLFAYRYNVNAKEEPKLITISPAFYELHSVKGEEGVLKGIIKNNTKEELKVTIEFRNVNIEVYLNENKLKFEETNDPNAAAYWFNIENDTFIIGPETTKDIEFKYKVPENVELKGYYPVLVYNAQYTFQKEKELKINDVIFALIYLDVGEVKGVSNVLSGKISKFDVSRRFLFTPNITFNVIFENIGNTYIHPRGKIHIYNKNGKHLSETPTINDKYEYLVNGESLEENILWKRNEKFKLIPDFGKYTAVAEIYYSPDQKSVSKAETNFYIIPLVHIILLLLCLIIIIAIIIGFIKWKKARKYPV